LEKTKEKQIEIEETYVKLSKFLKQNDPSFEKFMELVTWHVGIYIFVFFGFIFIFYFVKFFF